MNMSTMFEPIARRDHLSRRGLLAGTGAALALTAIGGASVSAQQATPAAAPTFSREQLERIIQFIHPWKEFAFLPGIDEELKAAHFGIDVATFQEITGSFAAKTKAAAEDLLADADFASGVDRLPFEPGSTVIAIGESSTDDLESWLAILTHVLNLRRPQDKIRVVNQGISGQTTTEALAAFVGNLSRQPDWIISFHGGNDASRYGHDPTKTLVSLEETTKNFKEMRHLADTQSKTKLAWMAPPTVNEEILSSYPPLQQAQLSLRNEDLKAIADVLTEQFKPVTDVQPLLGVPADPDLVLDDGIHPSIEGYKVIVKALVENLAG